MIQNKIHDSNELVDLLKEYFELLKPIVDSNSDDIKTGIMRLRDTIIEFVHKTNIH